MITPYIEANGNRYEFKVNRFILKEIPKLQKQYKVTEGDPSNNLLVLEDIGHLFLNSNYKLSKEEVEAIYDSYDPIELYELLGAVTDAVFTGMSAAEKQTKNEFLVEYRQKKEEQELAKEKIENKELPQTN